MHFEKIVNLPVNSQLIDDSSERKLMSHQEEMEKTGNSSGRIVLCLYGHFACRDDYMNCKVVEIGKFLLLGLMY